ncbi:MAG: DNA ligase, partial [Candidatus Methanofastidiosia archaeon]
MEFQRLAKIYESLEATTKRLEMTEILFEFLKSVPEDILDVVVYFLLGKIFPDWMERELGVGGKLLIRIISKVTGVPENEIADYVREEGDFGKACERASKRKKQVVLFAKSLTVSHTYNVLRRISEFTGPKSQERKLKNLANLFSFATPREVRYLSRIILGEMRTGVGEGTLRDAIANAFGYEPFEVERAYMLTNDLGAVAKAAKSKRLEELNVEIFKPIKFMLAQVSDFEDAFQRIPKAFCEIKYDGSRAQIHRKSDVIKIFSRRLENITEALPDLVNALRMS